MIFVSIYIELEDTIERINVSHESTIFRGMEAEDEGKQAYNIIN